MDSQDFCECGQSFFGMVFVVARDQNDVLPGAGSFSALVGDSGGCDRSRKQQ
jgi:hypothetical protein